MTVEDFACTLRDNHRRNPADSVERSAQSVTLLAGMTAGVEFVSQELIGRLLAVIDDAV